MIYGSYCLSREHCVLTQNGMYIKDLRCLNRDLVGDDYSEKFSQLVKDGDSRQFSLCLRLQCG